MCGTVSYISSKQINEVVIEEIIDAIKHRAPNGQGLYKGRYFMLVLRRLDIVDLSSGTLYPM